jgi:hypothetical protein
MVIPASVSWLEQREAPMALHSLEQGMSRLVSMQCAFTANLIGGKERRWNRTIASRTCDKVRTVPGD